MPQLDVPSSSSLLGASQLPLTPHRDQHQTPEQLEEQDFQGAGDSRASEGKQQDGKHQQRQEQEIPSKPAATSKKKLDANARPFLPASMQRQAGPEVLLRNVADGGPQTLAQHSSLSSSAAGRRGGAERVEGFSPRTRASQVTSSSRDSSGDIGRSTEHSTPGPCPGVSLVFEGRTAETSAESSSSALAKNSQRTAATAKASSGDKPQGQVKLDGLRVKATQRASYSSVTDPSGSSETPRCADDFKGSNGNTSSGGSSIRAARQETASQLQPAHRGRSSSSNSTSSSGSSVSAKKGTLASALKQQQQQQQGASGAAALQTSRLRMECVASRAGSDVGGLKGNVPGKGNSKPAATSIDTARVSVGGAGAVSIAAGVGPAAAAEDSHSAAGTPATLLPAAAGVSSAGYGAGGGIASHSAAWKGAVDWVQVFEAPQGPSTASERGTGCPKEYSSVPARLLHEKLLSPDR
jgi:hypothetical protein